MYTEHYLNYYNDHEFAGMIQQARECAITARLFAEQFYLPVMLSEDATVFLGCLDTQKGDFLCSVFHRTYELYGEECPFSETDFSVEEFPYGEFANVLVMQLPLQNIQVGNTLQIILILDAQTETTFWVSIEKGKDGHDWIETLDLDSFDWTREVPVPQTWDELQERVLELTVKKERARYHYIPSTCPLCGRIIQLGLLETELEGYGHCQAGDEDLEDALPALNAFEREFLITGMCPDCQCDVFQQELPEDTRRWSLE